MLKLQKVVTKICHLLQSSIRHSLHNVLINDCLCQFVYCTTPHFHFSFEKHFSNFSSTYQKTYSTLKSKGLVNNPKFKLLVMIQKISCSLQKLTIICLLHDLILRLCIMFHKVVIVSSNFIFKHPSFFFFIYLTRKTLIQRLLNPKVWKSSTYMLHCQICSAPRSLSPDKSPKIRC